MTEHEHHAPRTVKVNGDDDLRLVDHIVGWYMVEGHEPHDDCPGHGPSQWVDVGLRVGALSGDDDIVKEVNLSLLPREALELGTLLVAAANRAEFLRWDDNTDAD